MTPDNILSFAGSTPHTGYEVTSSLSTPYDFNTYICPYKFLLALLNPRSMNDRSARCAFFTHVLGMYDYCSEALYPSPVAFSSFSQS